MLCFKMENVIASIIYGGVSKRAGPISRIGELRQNTIVILAGEWTAAENDTMFQIPRYYSVRTISFIHTLIVGMNESLHTMDQV